MHDAPRPMQNQDQPGKFYLGCHYDLPTRARLEPRLLYDAKDLTTHAVCVGMTGSGKTGLCLALLEEAALNQIPVIAIDPKGDVGNLLLAFPELLPADFLPWVEEAEAVRENLTPQQLAERTAQRWEQGLEQWGQDGARIARFKSAADAVIYTPGSSAGLPLSVLRSFDAPPREILDDADLLRDRIGAAASGLLTLVGIDADPIKSREHILISQLLEFAWRAGHNLDLPTLIEQIQKPPLEQVGSIAVDTFYPPKARGDLALRLNNLLASPSFAGWLEGEPLSIPRLLYTPEGRPRLSILSIAHLSEPERMFLVTIVLNELLAWVRMQSGTSSLRAILYMDEVFGYFPPTANPPSKKPMLTLLKQARAFGLGVVLATQNPVDLDYKGLSNTGTWFLGRLQTERDKARVLEGLEGASAAAGSLFNRGEMEATLAGLGKRVFLMNSVHQDKPVVFESRWCLSYLRGPLTRGQIQTLMAERKASGSADDKASPSDRATDTARTMIDRPLVLLATAALRYVDDKAQLDYAQQLTARAVVDGALPDDPWEQAEVGSAASDTELPPVEPGHDSPALRALRSAGRTEQLKKQLVDHLNRVQRLTLYSTPIGKSTHYSRPEESQADFLQRARALLVAENQVQLDKLQQQQKKDLATIDDKISRLEKRLAGEKSKFWKRLRQFFLSAVQAVMQFKSSRKLTSQRNVSTATATMRNAGRVAEDRASAAESAAQLEQLRQQRADQAAEHAAQVTALKNPPDPVLSEYLIAPRKSDTKVPNLTLAWADPAGT